MLNDTGNAVTLLDGGAPLLLPVDVTGRVTIESGMKIMGTCIENGQVYVIVRQIKSQPDLDISRQCN